MAGGKRVLDLSMDTSSEINSDHPARRMLDAATGQTTSNAKTTRAKETSSKASGRSKQMPAKTVKASRNGIEQTYAAMKRTDRAMYDFLKKLQIESGSESCVVGSAKVAAACEISEKQVQISRKRLVSAGLIKTKGFDLDNPDIHKRGTIYIVNY